MSLPLHKKLFYILIFLLPLNLGKHFVFSWSYVDGLLIDYLIPTLYVTDILIVFILTTWWQDVRKLKKYIQVPYYSSLVQLLIFFLFCLLLSTFSALRVLPALYYFSRLVLYVLLSFYIFNEVSLKKELAPILTALSISVFFLSLLGIFQWVKQSSVFNNYLFFGEQPYTTSTPGIAIKSFFGIAKVPAYGTFRHSNVFGGFLSVVLVWILKKKSVFSYLTFVLGTTALCLTLSRLAILTFILGLLFSWLLLNKTKLKQSLILLISVFILGTGLLFSTIPEVFTSDYFTKDPSVYRRANFILSSIEAIKQRPLFGIGLNNSTVLIERFLPPARDIRFAQPVHNIFILTFAESGIFAIIFLGIFLFKLLIALLQKSSPTANMLLIALLQLLFLGSFDHYVFSIQQAYLLFWIVIGAALQLCIKGVDTTT